MGSTLDYLESFRAFVAAHGDDIPALLVVTQRPRDMTRQQLRDLKLALDAAGFTEAGLQTAWREATNQDIAATIIGYVRHVAAGEPLLPYKERVRKAVGKILASRPWTAPQLKWLDRIGKQLEVETVVDREALDHGQFKAEGGFARLNKVFDGKLEDVLRDLTDAVWRITELPDAVAVVTDVKSFYPSVQKDRLRGELARRCEQVGDGASRAAIRQFALGLIDLSSPKAAGTRPDTLTRAADRIRATKLKIEGYAEYLADEKARLDREVAEAAQRLRAKVAEIADRPTACVA